MEGAAARVDELVRAVSAVRAAMDAEEESPSSPSRCVECGEWRVSAKLACARGHVEVLRECVDTVIGVGSIACEGGRRERCVIGCLLASMVGDALGAPFEGRGWADIAFRCRGTLPKYFVPGTQMGIREMGERYGMYTDDTNSSLALAQALVDGGGIVDATRIAQSYATFYFDHAPKRGYPDSAIKVLADRGKNVRTSAMSSFCFGSFANGAAMRISPLGCIVSASDDLAGLVAECCVASHVHPDAVDAAIVQATAVRHLIALEDAKALDVMGFLGLLIATSGTEAVRSRLVRIRDLLQQGVSSPDAAVLETFVDIGFQLYAPDAIATAVWFLCRYDQPEEALLRCCALGGDCDTTNCMLGAMLGALHGFAWLPVRWFAMLENGEYGRDYCIDLGRRLARVRFQGCAEPEFAERPLYVLLARVLSTLSSELKLPPNKLAERWDRARLAEPSTRALWNALFPVIACDGVVRWDAASAVASFFADKTTTVESRTVNATEWDALFGTL